MFNVQYHFSSDFLLMMAYLILLMFFLPWFSLCFNCTFSATFLHPVTPSFKLDYWLFKFCLFLLLCLLAIASSYFLSWNYWSCLLPCSLLLFLSSYYLFWNKISFTALSLSSLWILSSSYLILLDWALTAVLDSKF